MGAKRTLAASCLMIVTALLAGYFSHGNVVKALKPFSTFPKNVGEWAGREDHFDQKTYALLGVDDSLLCNYFSPSGKHVQLYIGYYESQQQGDQIHSPKNCMPGAGWNIVETSLETIPSLEVRAERFSVIKMILEREGKRHIVLYWFQSRGRIVASEYKQKMYQVLDSIIKKRTDGAFVRLLSPLPSHENGAIPPYMAEFAGRLLPILKQYIPS
jgi:EpsI family protein